MNSPATKKNATIVDIAKLAHVTNITVSRAFSCPQKVKAATRDKILAIARDLNYTPNAFARNLKVRRSNIVGVITDSTYNLVYTEVIKQLCLECDRRGFSVMMFETAGSREREERAVDILLGYNASGIVLSVTSDSDAYAPAYLGKIAAGNTPLVLLDRDLKQSNLPGVFLNNLELGIKAGNYLAACHYRSLLIFGGPQDSAISRDRIEGVRRMLDPAETAVSVTYTNYAYDKARPLVLQALREILPHGRPDCIVGLNGPISLAVMGACRTLEIQRTMRYFSFDAVPYAQDFGYKVPCIANDPREWGARISELLFRLIDHHNSPACFDRIFINGVLRI